MKEKSTTGRPPDFSLPYTRLDINSIEQQPGLLWRRIPESLKNLAVAECEDGNKITSILDNQEQSIVVLVFEDTPRINFGGDSEIRVHTSQSYGNYCYDGTRCTYEELRSGCFLALDDPEYVENAF